MGIPRSAVPGLVLAVLAATSTRADAWVLPAGQEELIGAHLGGEPVLEDCRFEGASIQPQGVDATYRCGDDSPFSVGLRHLSAVPDPLAGGNVAVVAAEQAPPAFAPALAARLTARGFALQWKTTEARTAKPPPPIEPPRSVFPALGAVIAALLLYRRFRPRRKARRENEGGHGQAPTERATATLRAALLFFAGALLLQGLLKSLLLLLPGTTLDVAACSITTTRLAQDLMAGLGRWATLDRAAAAAVLYAGMRRHVDRRAAAWAGVLLLALATASHALLPMASLPGRTAASAVFLHALFALARRGGAGQAGLAAAALGFASIQHGSILPAIALGFVAAYSGARPVLALAAVPAAGLAGLLARGWAFPLSGSGSGGDAETFLVMAGIGWIAGFPLRDRSLPHRLVTLVLPLATAAAAIVLDQAHWVRQGPHAMLLPVLAAVLGLFAAPAARRLGGALPRLDWTRWHEPAAWGVAAALLVLLQASGERFYDADSARDVAIAIGIVDHGVFPLHGPMLHGPFLHHSIIYNLLLAGLLWLWRDPVVLEVALVAAQAAAALLFLDLARRLLSTKVAIAATLLLLGSAVVQSTHAHVSHAPYVLLFEVLCLRALWDFQTRGRPVSLVLAFFWVSVAVQFHLTALPVVPVVLAVWLASGRRLTTGWLLAAWAGAVLPLTPWVYLARSWSVLTDFGPKMAFTHSLAEHSLVSPSLVAVLVLGRPPWLQGRPWRVAALAAGGAAAGLGFWWMAGSDPAPVRLFSLALPKITAGEESIERAADGAAMLSRLFGLGGFFGGSAPWAKAAWLSVGVLGFVRLARRARDDDKGPATLVLRWMLLGLPVALLFVWIGDYARYRVHLMPPLCLGIAFGLRELAAAARSLMAGDPAKPSVPRGTSSVLGVVALLVVADVYTGEHRPPWMRPCDDCLSRPETSRKLLTHLERALGLGGDIAWRVRGNDGRHAFGEVARTHWYTRWHLMAPGPPSLADDRAFYRLERIRDRRGHARACVGEQVPGTALQLVRYNPALSAHAVWEPHGGAGTSDEHVEIRLPYRFADARHFGWPRSMKLAEVVSPEPLSVDHTGVRSPARGTLRLTRTPPDDPGLNGLEVVHVGRDGVADCRVDISADGSPLPMVESFPGGLQVSRFRIPPHQTPIELEVRLECGRTLVDFLDVYDTTVRDEPRRRIAETG